MQLVNKKIYKKAKKVNQGGRSVNQYNCTGFAGPGTGRALQRTIVRVLPVPGTALRTRTILPCYKVLGPGVARKTRTIILLRSASSARPPGHPAREIPKTRTILRVLAAARSPGAKKARTICPGQFVGRIITPKIRRFSPKSTRPRTISTKSALLAPSPRTSCSTRNSHIFIIWYYILMFQHFTRYIFHA